MAGGPFILGAAALAIFAVARRRTTGGGTLPPPTGGRVSVDPLLLQVNPAAPQTNTLARRTQTDLQISRTTSKIVGQVLQTVGTIASAAAGVSLTTLLLQTLSTIASIPALAALGIIAVVVAIFVVVTSIVGQLKNESLRIKTAIAATGGTFYTVNTWEWKSTSAWLTQMGIPFTSSSVVDTRLNTSFYDDQSKKYTMHHDRVTVMPTITSITAPNVGITAADWLQLQLLIRIASLDYFTRVGRLLYYVSLNCKAPVTAYGSEVPMYVPVPQGAPPVPDPKANAISYFENNVLPTIWSDMQLIGDTTPHNENDINDPLAKGVVAAQAGSYNDVVSQWASTRTMDQIRLNNKFMSILSALSIFKVEPRTVESADWPKMAQHIYWGAGLRPEYDFCWVEGGLIKFDQNYYGLLTILDVRAFMQGGAGAVTMVGVDANGKVVEMKSNF